MLSTNAAWPQCAYSLAEVQAFSSMLRKKCEKSVIRNPRLYEELQNLLNAAALDSQLDQNAERTSRSSLVQIEECDEVLNELPGILNSVFRMKVAKEREVNQARPEKCLEIARDRSTVYYHSTIINGNSCNCPFIFGGESWKEAQEKSVRAANNTLEGVQLQNWVMNKLLGESCWYRDRLSVLCLLYNKFWCSLFLCVHAFFFIGL